MTILIFENKNILKSVGHSKHRNNKEAKNVLFFILKKKHMREEKDIASMENNGYWNESYCYISESG